MKNENTERDSLTREKLLSYLQNWLLEAEGRSVREEETVRETSVDGKIAWTIYHVKEAAESGQISVGGGITEAYGSLGRKLRNAAFSTDKLH